MLTSVVDGVVVVVVASVVVVGRLVVDGVVVVVVASVVVVGRLVVDGGVAVRPRPGSLVDSGGSVPMLTAATSFEAVVVVTTAAGCPWVGAVLATRWSPAGSRATVVDERSGSASGRTVGEVWLLAVVVSPSDRGRAALLDSVEG
ncbi:MAG: hypothetical protein R8J94_05800 [Acidimicrobiia bacterium]|nr:hypothetical protein [Acidimicrobiia bacterium]